MFSFIYLLGIMQKWYPVLVPSTPMTSTTPGNRSAHGIPSTPGTPVTFCIVLSRMKNILNNFKKNMTMFRKRQWYRNLNYFFKIFKGQSIPRVSLQNTSVSKTYNIWTTHFSGKHVFLEVLFFHQLALNGII